MKIETIGDLLDALADLSEDLPVRIAFQPNYPLAATISNVRVIEREERRPFQKVLWIAVDQITDYDESPYGPRDAWEES
jgi:hypothetical protein